MKRKHAPYWFFGLATCLTLSALVLLILRPGLKDTDRAPKSANRPDAAFVEDTPQASIDAKDDELTPSDDDGKLTPGGRIPDARSAQELVDRFVKAFEAGDTDTLSQLLSSANDQAAVVARLESLATQPLRLRRIHSWREIGETELNKRSRWAIELEKSALGVDRIALDLMRDQGRWKIERLSLPGESDGRLLASGPIDVADEFIHALIRQDLAYARSLVATELVSDAKLVGLCIIFEEGGYRMRSGKPLRTMFERKDAVGFLAAVEASDSKQAAQFSLTLQTFDSEPTWRVSEVNLDQLLLDYAERMAGGDIYYSPLVKNPGGGETIALFFAFDEAEMSPRTERQIEIVSLLLKDDPKKRITLSGHTDALGSKDYNRELSVARAQVVRDTLIANGVDAAQIITQAKGASQPRRPNFTESGEDNPEGRRANRRTEIYLDF